MKAGSSVLTKAKFIDLPFRLDAELRLHVECMNMPLEVYKGYKQFLHVFLGYVFREVAQI